MTDAKLTELSAMDGDDIVAGDLLYIVDVSAITSGSKRITVEEFFSAIPVNITATNFATSTALSGEYNLNAGESVRTLGGSGWRNTFVGDSIAYKSAVNTDGVNIIGCDNTLVGAVVAENLSTGYRNCVLGATALRYCTSGKANVAIGYGAAREIISGYNNMCIGDGALFRSTDGYYHTCVGVEAGLSVGNSATTHSVTAIGHHAAYGNYAANIANLFTYGAGNLSTWIGVDAGGDLNTTSTHVNTTAVGARAGYLGGANCIFVGYNAGRSCTSDNRLYIDALDRSGDANEQSKSLMYGVFAADPANQVLTVNGQLRCSISSRHNDNVEAYFGTDSDSQIYDDGSSLYIDSGSGRVTYIPREVRIQTNSSVQVASGNGRMSVKGEGGTIGIYIEQAATPSLAGYIYVGDNANLLFGTNNTQRMLISYDGKISTSGNFGVGQSTWGTNATKTLALGTGTAPTGSVTDACQIYSADQAAGNACPHVRTENGAILKLYAETTGVGEVAFSQETGSYSVNENSTFAGYTIQQIVKALQLQGLLT